MSRILPEVVMERKKAQPKPGKHQAKVKKNKSATGDLSLNCLWRSLSTTLYLFQRYNRQEKRKKGISPLLLDGSSLNYSPLETFPAPKAVQLCTFYSEQPDLRTWVHAGATYSCNSLFSFLQPMTNLVFFNIQVLLGPF